MTDGALADAAQQLAQAFAMFESALATATGDEVLSALTIAEGATRLAEHVVITAVGAADREGVFAAKGCRTAAHGLADLLGWEHREAAARVDAARHVTDRTSLVGEALPPELPATATLFASRQARLRHVITMVGLMESSAARRLAPAEWALAEREIAALAPSQTPALLRRFGARLIDQLDQDGAEPDSGERPQINELHIRGSRISGVIEDTEMLATIVTVIEAKAAPRTAEDTRSPARRRASALAEVCGFVLDHGDAPHTAGHRPHLTVTMTLDDLRGMASAASLDLGGDLSPAQLRRIACDAKVLPVVLGGAGQPLDVGRELRTVPEPMRRAVAARDRGCAHPGCDRPPSWCEIHHVIEWQHGGPTCVDNLVMLCRAHHRHVHETDWTVHVRDGQPVFVPPAWADPAQVPRWRPRLPAELLAA